MFLHKKLKNKYKKKRWCDIHISSKQFHLKGNSLYFVFFVNRRDNAAFHQS